MPNEVLLTSFFVMWYALIILAVLFIISGIDDIFFDTYYWVRYLWRLWKTRHYEPLTYEKLSAVEEQLIAVMVPCWQEADVISAMLKHNIYSIDYKNYYFFVGVYPNDPATIAEVEGVATLYKRVQCVIGDKPGPTNKAMNLNGIYAYIKAFEMTLQKSFNIIVFHDSEDMIHPLSFKLYNYLIPRKDMIQIPIFPLKVSNKNLTHWLYADEFAENHTKNIVVRESIHGHVPSAGVGTAFNRKAFEVLENPQTGEPFSTGSLTEDYRTSLLLRVHKLKQIFVTQHITRMQWKKSWIPGRGYVQKPVREIVAIRALFPLSYIKSVRQKARWIIGIVFQEWYHTRWPTDLKICYTLAHDRKSFITHFINGFGYFLFAYWTLYAWFTVSKPEYPTLQEQLNFHHWVWWLIIIATLIMGERLIQRTIATYRVYGVVPASLVIPRACYGNLLNLHALLRAYWIYFRAPTVKSVGKQPVWDKTKNRFLQEHVLVPYRKRLGDLLISANLLTEAQLQKGLALQHETGERLGQILCRLKFITEVQLVQLLSSQYHLPLFPHRQVAEAEEACLSLLPKRLGRWLQKQKVHPLKIDLERKILTLGIKDPTNELLLRSIMRTVPYKTEFQLIDHVTDEA